MIKKYKKFNEGINQYLKGPSKEEVWDAFGSIFFDEAPSSPKEFLDKIIQNSTKIDRKHNFSYKFNDRPEHNFITLYNREDNKTEDVKSEDSKFYITINNDGKYNCVYVSDKIGKVLLKYYIDDLKNIYGTGLNNTWLLKYFYTDYFNFEPAESSIYWRDM